MKKQFSQHWKKSKQRRKKRKFLANAPSHTKRKIMASNLSKDLRKKYGRRSFPIKKGDIIRVMVGNFKKKTGKVLKVERKTRKVFVDGIQRTKKDGSKADIPFDTSNLQIIELDLEDKKRQKALERKNKSNSKTKEKK